MVVITLGQGAELHINDYNTLAVVQTLHGEIRTVTHLGRATRKRIEEIQSYLERLKVFAVEEEAQD